MAPKLLVPFLLCTALAACSTDPSASAGALGGVMTQPALKTPPPRIEKQTVVTPSTTRIVPGGIDRYEEEPEEEAADAMPREGGGDVSEFVIPGGKTPPKLSTNGGVREIGQDEEEQAHLKVEGIDRSEIQGPGAPTRVEPLGGAKLPTPEIGPGARPPGK
jgi:hypothetical protein